MCGGSLELVILKMKGGGVGFRAESHNVNMARSHQAGRNGSCGWRSGNKDLLQTRERHVAGRRSGTEGQVATG